MNDDHNATLSKVPAVTLGFWVIKIAATTLGETGGDTLIVRRKRRKFIWMRTEGQPS